MVETPYQKIKSLHVLSVDINQKPDDICISMHLAKRTIYRYAKIANTYTIKELDNMTLKNK